MKLPKDVCCHSKKHKPIRETNKDIIIYLHCLQVHAQRSARRARSQIPVILDEILLTVNSRVTGILKFERRFEIYPSEITERNSNVHFISGSCLKL